MRYFPKPHPRYNKYFQYSFLLNLIYPTYSIFGTFSFDTVETPTIVSVDDFVAIMDHACEYLVPRKFIHQQ